MPDVSFVVPTLNRGRYVVRAVQSCLDAAARLPALTVEVIVLDSTSDDGSWEMLKSHFATDSRVVLSQNERGLGPTRSWLDGARQARGRFVTFVWSDDYVFPWFLSTLAMALEQDHGAVAIGRGVPRDVDCDSLPDEENVPSMFLAPHDVVRGHLGLSEPEPPVSPACALFARDCFQDWMTNVELLCRSSNLREHFMWRRAIGPDLLLFLAAARARRPIIMFDKAVSQFSSHPSSITISSAPWTLSVGYWLAKQYSLHVLEEVGAPAEIIKDVHARLIAAGLGLSGLAFVQKGASAATAAMRAELRAEVGALWSAFVARDGTMSASANVARHVRLLMQRHAAVIRARD